MSRGSHVAVSFLFLFHFFVSFFSFYMRRSLADNDRHSNHSPFPHTLHQTPFPSLFMHPSSTANQKNFSLDIYKMTHTRVHQANMTVLKPSYTHHSTKVVNIVGIFVHTLHWQSHMQSGNSQESHKATKLQH